MVDKITSPVSQLGLINKVNEIIDNGAAITVDTVISSTSTNPVQNKVIYEALTLKADKTEIPTVGDANTTIKVNNSAVGTINANATSASSINISVPTTITELASTTQMAAINSGVTSTVVAQVTTNKNEISTIKSTMSGYGNIVTHSVSEFATAAQGSLADSALQSITSSDVTTALGYTPQAQLTQGANITISNGTISATDTTYNQGSGIVINNKTISVATTIASKTDIGDGEIVFTQGGVAKGTITANQTTATTIALDGSSGGSSSLSGLTDVTITSATTGQVLGYNGTVWVNTTPTTVTFRAWS